MFFAGAPGILPNDAVRPTVAALTCSRPIRGHRRSHHTPQHGGRYVSSSVGLLPQPEAVRQQASSCSRTAIRLTSGLSTTMKDSPVTTPLAAKSRQRLRSPFRKAISALMASAVFSDVATPGRLCPISLCPTGSGCGRTNPPDPSARRSVATSHGRGWPYSIPWRLLTASGPPATIPRAAAIATIIPSAHGASADSATSAAPFGPHWETV